MTLVFEGGFDGFGHVVLAATVLEGEGGAGENAAGREEVVEVRQILRGGGRDRDGGRGGQGWNRLIP